MRLPVDPPALRRGVLAVSVMDDVDVEPRADGVLLPGRPDVLIAWRDLARACGIHEPASPPGRHRLASLMRLQRLVADLGEDAPRILRGAAVLVALPLGHLDHLGRSWVMGRLPGGALDLGIGVRGLLDDPDGVVALPSRVAVAAGLDVEQWWPQVRDRAEAMSALAVDHLRRDGLAAGVLRPIGGCDVLALLAGRPLREALAEGDGAGMRAVAVPGRRRGWYDLARIDPAYVATAWQLADPLERGVDVPLLVTKDEVALPRIGGAVTAQSLDQD
jgi:hypothetical protein